MTFTRDELAEKDAQDPLAFTRARFFLPEGIIYLDGNSLGALPFAAIERANRVLKEEWGRSLISSWNDHGWMDLPARVAARIAPLIGAGADEVFVTDSVSVNTFKILSAALQLRTGRRFIVTDKGNFPTDTYIAQGLAAHLGEERAALRFARTDELEAALANGDVAAVLFSHVDYRSARIEDMRRITTLAHAHGALAIWDLSHSAGAIPVDLNGAEADFAVGCGYKFLNGGPGAPAFVFAASRHHKAMRQPLSGWLGHASPFTFSTDYVPADGIRRMAAGTPPVISMSVLDAALTAFDGAPMAALRRKSVALTSLLIELIERRCAGHGLKLASPRDPDERGSHVLFSHLDGYAIVQRLIARGVVGDFRAPDGVRLGVAPLYNRYVDIWDAVAHLADLLATREWDRPEYRARKAVT